jgi:hypothetical protein
MMKAETYILVIVVHETISIMENEDIENAGSEPWHC